MTTNPKGVSTCIVGCGREESWPIHRGAMISAGRNPAVRVWICPMCLEEAVSYVLRGARYLYEEYDGGEKERMTDE